MKINGVELGFRLYDADNAGLRERYMAELEKMKHIEDDMPEGTEAVKNKYLCGRIKGIFDSVFGKGTGEKVCGGGNDLLVSMDAYEQLISEQIRQDNQYKAVINKMKRMNSAKKR